MAREDADKDVRAEAVKSLTSLVKSGKPTSREIIVKDILESCLNDKSSGVCLAWVELMGLLHLSDSLLGLSSHQNDDVQKSALELVMKFSTRLLKWKMVWPLELREYVIHQVMPYVLKICMNETSEQQLEAKKTLESIHHIVTDKISSSIFSSIPSFLTSISAKGKDFVVHYAENLNVGDTHIVSSTGQI
ncbi:hypothetical protein BDQ17DRAFT_1326782 [Cyathus striatus]|nr:hypothetical protein BDQ17DRAFT_1326782 [Cyathus striatus]